jgi:hypothetical protein
VTEALGDLGWTAEMGRATGKGTQVDVVVRDL